MTVCTQNIPVAVLTLYKTEDTDLFYDLYLRHPSTQRKRPANALLTAEPYCSVYGLMMIPEHTYTDDYDDAKGVWEAPGYSLEQLKEITKDVPNDKLVLVSLIAEPGVYWTAGAFFDGVAMGKDGYPVIKWHTPPRRFNGFRWEVIDGMITFLQLDFFLASDFGGPLNEIAPTDWQFPADKRLLTLYDVQLGKERRLFAPRYTAEQIEAVLCVGEVYSVWAVTYKDGRAIWYKGDVRVLTVDDEGICYDV